MIFVPQVLLIWLSTRDKTTEVIETEVTTTKKKGYRQNKEDSDKQDKGGCVKRKQTNVGCHHFDAHEFWFDVSREPV